MWIRSQDRTELIDITGKRVCVITDTRGETRVYVDSMCSNISGCSELGEYGSKVRAIEVLDEIGDTLKTNAAYDEITGKTRICKEVVFEMPDK